MLYKIKYIISFFLILLTVACSPNLDQQVLELINGKNLWLEKVKDQQYSYDYLISCFCEHNGRKIRVVSGFDNVISATEINGSFVPKSRVRSMKQHYENIFKALEEQARSKYVSVNVKYDKEYGYPFEIKYKNSGAADTSYTMELSNIILLGLDESFETH